MPTRIRLVPAWPAPLSSYDYTRFLTRSRWSWEFLRRNQAYVRDWRVGRIGLAPVIHLSSSARVTRMRRRFKKAEHWGLFFFADPRLNALEADVFWLPESYKRVLTAVISREHVPGQSSPITLAAMRCVKSILVTASGDKHLILRDPRHVLQVLCLGESITLDPGEMGLLINELPNVEPEIRLLRRFAAFYRQRKPGAKPTGWTPQSTRLRNVLVALDGALHDATYREIAETIHGVEAVAERWRGARRDLKDRTVRLVRRGHHLSADGYRDLLR